MVRESLQVGVVALSDGIKQYRRDMALSGKVAKRLGFEACLAPGIWEQVLDFSAGETDSRMAQFKWLVRSKAPVGWMGEGGYSMMDMIASWEMTKKMIQLHEQWGGVGIGYSDSGCFAAVANYIGRCFVVGPNFCGLHQWDTPTHDYLRTLFLEGNPGCIDQHHNWMPWVDGQVTAPIFAGNLEVITRMFGSGLDPIANADPHKGIILAFEELDLTQLDVMREVHQVFRHDKVSNIKGLIIGRMLVNGSDYPIFSKKNPMEEMILKLVKINRPGIPVASLLDFGHPEWGEGVFWKVNRQIAISKSFIPLVNGLMATLTVSENGCSLQYEENNLWR
jgi:muramoyltetrapeptide carboxypeptidase LdcA involved in peptidoglycan recycling